MQNPSNGYERLAARIISAARHCHAHTSRDLPLDEYIRVMERTLCDANLVFSEPSPGLFVIEDTVAVMLGQGPNELQAHLASSGLAIGVWLDFAKQTLGVERVWAAPTQEGESTSLVFPEASVLTAVMTHPHDFETARNESWYRIPARSAPKFFPPDYIAFYFTKAFKDEAFSICYFAPVRGHELLTRRDLLPEEPNHPRADQQYYKVQLGQLARREPPIISKTWRRITFVLTNGRRFSSATEINELILGPKEHDILWRALKERGLHAERNYVIRDERAVYKVDLAVMCRDGTVGIMCTDPTQQPNQRTNRNPNKFPLFEFTPQQIETQLADCMASIQTAVHKMGGINN